MHALMTFALLAGGEAAVSPAAISFLDDTDRAIIAFGLLVASLVVFIVSTRQWPVLQRSLIWGLGVALLGLSVCASSDVGGGKFFSSLNDVLGNETARSSILSNRGYVVGYAEPLLNIMFMLCAAFAAVALIAFTPGEAIERNLRRVALVIGGAVLGALLTLGLAIVGLGGNAKRAVYIARLTDADVIDGDTIRMGDVSLRIAGIEAPETNSEEDRANDPTTLELRSLVRDNVVVCARPRLDEENADKPPPESFGRPVVECFLAKKGFEEGNLGQILVNEKKARACRKEAQEHPYWKALKAASECVKDGLPPCPNGYRDACGLWENRSPVEAKP